VKMGRLKIQRSTLSGDEQVQSRMGQRLPRFECSEPRGCGMVLLSYPTVFSRK